MCPITSLPWHLFWSIRGMSIFMLEAVKIIDKVHSPWPRLSYASFFCNLASTSHLSVCSLFSLNFRCPSLIVSEFLPLSCILTLLQHTAEMAGVLLTLLWPGVDTEPWKREEGGRLLQVGMFVSQAIRTPVLPAALPPLTTWISFKYLTCLASVHSSTKKWITIRRLFIIIQIIILFASSHDEDEDQTSSIHFEC